MDCRMTARVVDAMQGLSYTNVSAAMPSHMVLPDIVNQRFFTFFYPVHPFNRYSQTKSSLWKFSL